jgi:probable HAF family extracellular repeat protein
MVDLGTLGGRSIARGVNDKGQVVGYSDLSTAGTHAFVWTEQDGLIDLGTLGTYSFAHDINDRGAVVGSSNPPNAGATAFLWTERGGMLGLGDFFTADAVNAKEQIMGLRTTGQSTPNGYPVFHGVFWTEATGMVDIGSAAGFIRSFAEALNNRGQIVGRLDNEPGGPSRPFLWTEADGMMDLGCLGWRQGTCQRRERPRSDRGQQRDRLGADARVLVDGNLRDAGPGDTRRRRERGSGREREG